MLANITIVGNLGRDAETRTASSGPITSFSVATSHGYGERKRSTWWRVTVFGKSAEWAGKLRKGDKVAVVGSAYMDEWKGTDGSAKQTLSIDARNVTSLMSKPAEGGGYGGGGASDDSGIPF